MFSFTQQKIEKKTKNPQSSKVSQPIRRNREYIIASLSFQFGTFASLSFSKFEKHFISFCFLYCQSQFHSPTMAEGLVTDLIKQLVSVAAREAEQEIRLVVGVDEEIKKLEGNLRTVKAVLKDAEKKQVTEEAVQLWLDKLNNACYEMEDVVDEWSTAMIKLAIQKQNEYADNNHIVPKKKVCSFIPSSSCCFRQANKVFLRHDIAHKIKELNGRLDDIAKEKDRYQFHLTNDPVERPQTTSFVDESEICGRDSVKDGLVGMLLGKGSEEEPHLISIVGMGGIGKTTLAQLAYNDPKVQVYFKIKVWVCVSDPFDQCKVAKDILESIKVQSFEAREIFESINEIGRASCRERVCLAV